MSELVQWSKNAIRRVIEATKQVESMHIGRPHARNPVITDGGFWAKITGSSGGKYSWVAVEPAGSNTFTDQSGWGSGTTSHLYAKEVNGLTSVSNGKIVFLTPVINEDFFVFHYSTTATTTTGQHAGGCCGAPCVKKRRAYLTSCSGLNLCQKYQMAMIAELGGTVVMEWVSGCVFESDTISRTCNAGSDNYFWRLTAASDIYTATLEIIFAGSGSGSGQCADVVCTYVNNNTFDPICGTTFILEDRMDLPSDLADIMPCSVCVYPPSSGTITSSCLTALGSQIGRTDSWPSTLIGEIVSASGNFPGSEIGKQWVYGPFPGLGSNNLTPCNNQGDGIVWSSSFDSTWTNSGACNWIAPNEAVLLENLPIQSGVTTYKFAHCIFCQTTPTKNIVGKNAGNTVAGPTGYPDTGTFNNIVFSTGSFFDSSGTVIDSTNHSFRLHDGTGESGRGTVRIYEV